MLSQIAIFLLDTVFTLFGMALLLRLWMQLTRLPARNPISHAVFQVTDWLVRPLRRIIPGVGGIDWATVVAAWLTAVVFLLAVIGLTAGNPLGLLPAVLGIAVLNVLKWGISLVMWVTLLMAILSWVNPHSPITPVIQQLTDPLLDPIRRVIPRLGGFDISPLVLFILAQVLLMVIAGLSVNLFGLRHLL
ncbi:YggT family protein [Cupriavidus gilardii]|uniref:YggT family protein n=1 Tax=Cupriavidus cauae TaxID=2608999 RepID=A0A5M8B6E0_9BURK|nr:MULTISPECIES: YggT family protein [Cupriavidus]KAA0178652.1 YggT family protein [Cupriavidus gilardii]KAA6131083.1 YggT family protein [Cupriavidus cauae]MCA7086711.1 YggT family protein [Cupriavidus sp. DB3]MCG5263199.1 YggT family protein [Cupriavidus gilardii]MDF9432685.1 YggT family protein [Cupriavidus gilardii]